MHVFRWLLLWLCCTPLFAQAPPYLPVKKGDKWAYADTNGVVRTGFVYDFASEFAATGFASAGKDGGMLLLDSRLQELGYPQAELILPLSKNLLWTIQDNRSVLENLDDGRRIEGIEGIQYVNNANPQLLLARNGLQYLYNMDMQPLTEQGYAQIMPWRQGLYMAGRENAWALCSEDGRQLCDTVYSSFELYPGNMFVALDSGYRKMLYHTTRGLLLQYEADYIELSTGFVVATDQARTYALILAADSSVSVDTSGYIFASGEAACLLVKPGGEKVRVLDTNARLLLPLRYDEVSPAAEGFYVRNGDMWGFCLPGSNELFPCVYNEFHLFGRAAVTSVLRNGKLGIVNTRGQVLFKPEYNEVVFGPGRTLARLKKGNSLYVASFDDAGNCTDVTDYTNVITIEAGAIGGETFRAGRAPQSRNSGNRPGVDFILRDNGYWKFVYARGWGFFSHTGDTLLKPLYSRVDTLNAYLTRVYDSAGNQEVLGGGGLKIRLDGFCALVDERSSRLVLRPGYLHIRLLGSKVLAYESDFRVWVLDPESRSYSNRLKGPFMYVDFNDRTGKIRAALKGSMKTEWRPCYAANKEHGAWDIISPFPYRAMPQGATGSSSNYRVTLNNAEWQYLDPDLEALANPGVRYRFIGNDVQGYHTFVDMQNKWGVLDDTGAVLLSGFDELHILDGQNGDKPVFVAYKRQSSWHMVQLQNGTMRSEPDWRSLEYSGEHIFRAVTHKRKTVFLNAVSGTESEPLDLLNAGPCTEGKITMRDRNGWFWGDAAGNNTIAARFVKLQPFSDGLAAVYKDGRWGYANASGNMRIGFKYNEAEPFRKGLAVVSLKGGKALIDTAGVYVYKPIYSDVRYYPQNGHVLLNRNGRWQVWSTQGQKLCSESFGRVLQADSTCTVLQDEGINTIVTKNGTMLRLEKGTDLKEGFSEGWCIIKQKGLYYYMDTSGTLRPQAYTYAWPYSQGRAFVSTAAGRLLMLDANGKAIPDFSVDIRFRPQMSVSAFESGIATLDDGVRVHFFSRFGKEISFPTQSLSGIKRLGNFWLVKNNGHYGILSKYGHTIYPMVFDKASATGAGGHTVLGSEFVAGVYNHKGEEILPPECTSLSLLNNTFIRVLIHNKLVWLRRSGGILWDERTAVPE